MARAGTARRASCPILEPACPFSRFCVCCLNSGPGLRARQCDTRRTGKPETSAGLCHHARGDERRLHQGAAMNLIRLIQGDTQPDVDLRRTYDAIVIGSGAAGGMAAHVMTAHGMKVLMLEAGRKLDLDKELKSTEWPYQHPRRGEMPPGHHAPSLHECTIRQPPYARE